MSLKTRFVAVGAAIVVAVALSATIAQAFGSIQTTVSGSITSYTVDSTAARSADRTQVTLSGTITCPSGDSVFTGGFVSEVVGRIQHTAGGGGNIACTGEASQPWSLTLTSPVALVPGPANVGSFAIDMTFPMGFGSGSASGTILLVP